MPETVRVCGKEVRITGRLLRVGRLEADGFEFVEFPGPLLRCISEFDTRIDLSLLHFHSEGVCSGANACLPVRVEQLCCAAGVDLRSLVDASDKAPTNALIAQAVRSCAERGFKYLLYSRFAYTGTCHAIRSFLSSLNGQECGNYLKHAGYASM